MDGSPATSGVGARRRLLDEADRSVLEDARRRAAAGQLRGPIRRVDCEPFPRNVAGIGAEDSTELRFGRYACLAVTAEFLETEATSAGSSGTPTACGSTSTPGATRSARSPAGPPRGSSSGAWA